MGDATVVERRRIFLLSRASLRHEPHSLHAVVASVDAPGARDAAQRAAGGVDLMNVKLLAQKIVRSIRAEGMQTSLRKAPRYLIRSRRDVDDFDARYGTDTGGFEHIWQFRIDSDNARFGTHYRATSERDLVQALTALPDDPRGLTFIDLGCGKGKTLIVAARLGFRAVIGVE